MTLLYMCFVLIISNRVMFFGLHVEGLMPYDTVKVQKILKQTDDEQIVNLKKICSNKIMRKVILSQVLQNERL